MKQLFLLIIVFISLHVNAQDVIVMNDGKTILSKILEVNKEEIKYKKFSNQNGPTYTLSKLDIISINYENGEIDKFGDTPKENYKPQQSVIINPEPDQRNNQLIRKYNKVYEKNSNLKETKSHADYACCILGVDEHSVLSTKDLEMTLFRVNTWLYNFKIILRNKSNHIIYVDLGNSFKIYPSGKYMTFFDNSQTTVTHGTSNGANVNVGSIVGALGIGGVIGSIANGVNVETGESQSVATTYINQRVIAIPPKGTYSLEEIYFDDFLKWKFKKGEILRGVLNEYTLNNSKAFERYVITYSSNESFKEVFTLKTSIYAREMIGIKKTDFSYRLFENNFENALRLSMNKILKNYEDGIIFGFAKIDPY